MDAAERKEILSRYVDHSRRFDAVAKRRSGGAEVIPFAQTVHITLLSDFHRGVETHIEPAWFEFSGL